MDIQWIKVLPMLPIFIEGVIAFICGLYQLFTGEESFLIRGYAKKYNYEQCKQKFIRACGMLYIIDGALIAFLLSTLYVCNSSVYIMILVSIPVICLLGIGQHIMIKLYTDNLENRKY